MYSPEPVQQEIVSSPGPVSPPTAGEREEGGDYLSSRPTGTGSALVVSPDLGLPPPGVISGGGDGRSSPLRRSVFMESREDMGGEGSGPGGR